MQQPNNIDFDVGLRCQNNEQKLEVPSIFTYLDNFRSFHIKPPLLSHQSDTMKIRIDLNLGVIQ